MSDANFLVYLVSFSIIIDWTWLIVSRVALSYRMTWSSLKVAQSAFILFLDNELLNGPHGWWEAVNPLKLLFLWQWAIWWGSSLPQWIFFAELLVEASLFLAFSRINSALILSPVIGLTHMYDTKNKTSKHSLSNGICFKFLTQLIKKLWPGKISYFFADHPVQWIH